MSDEEKTTEELEAEAAEAERKLALLRAKKAKKSPPPIPRTLRDGETLRRIQQDTTVKNAKSTWGGYCGPTLINKLEAKLDKRRKMFAEQETGTPKYQLMRGTVMAYADSIATLRSSSVEHELERSDERMGTSGKG